MTARNAILANVIDAAWATQFERCVASYDIFRDRLPALPLSYTRSLLYRTDDYEIVGMRWSPGSVTPLHDHGTSNCWVFVVEGELFVENFDRIDDGDDGLGRFAFADSARFTAGMLDHRLGWRELHRVRNTGTSDAFSIQLYAQPLSRYHIFERSGGPVRETLAKYDATVSLR